MRLDLNNQFIKALDIIKNGNNIFITGKAGTGKSTFLTHLRDTCEKKIAFLAPTGVAAVNIKGQTIHSFFRFKPDVTVDKIKKVSDKDAAALYKNLDAIVIDEVSMVRADLMDCVDRFMRLHGSDKNTPFGGVQMILIGDLYQLPPVVTSAEREIFNSFYKSHYFFDSHIFDGFSMDFIELEKVYRQSDPVFIDLLNAIRNNTATDEHLRAVNSRLAADYEPDMKNLSISLTTTNLMAREINTARMTKLKGKSRIFKGSIKGDFEMKYLPTDIELELKIGAQVMLLNNDPEGRWVNGSVGKIIDYENGDDTTVIIAELADGDIVEITPFTWELFRFSYESMTGRLVSESIGSFTQYPLTPAWAITIHKSQGKTFDNVVIDIGRGTFAHGQMYVALSRCTSLEGIVLKRPVEKRHIFMDRRVVEFVTGYQYRLAESLMSSTDKIKLINDAIAGKEELRIVYLKKSDDRSERSIRPAYVGEMEFAGKTFTGVRGFDSITGSERTFRVGRILEIETITDETAALK